MTEILELPLVVPREAVAGLGEGEAPGPAATVRVVRIVVVGKPVTQGSMRSLGTGRPSVHSNAKTLKPWRLAVKDAALAAANGHRFDVPVDIRCVYYFDRPAGHYGSGRNSHLLKDTAPAFPANRTSGDIDKLDRAVFDALVQAGVLTDDSLVVDGSHAKRYAGPVGLDRPGVVIEIREALPPATAGEPDV